MEPAEQRPVQDVVDAAGGGEQGAGEQAADLGQRGPDQRRRGQQAVVCRSGWSFPRFARVGARKAWATMQALRCRCQGVHLRTWYWSSPSRSLPWALFSSIFQRIPATAISSGIGVGSGAWARKNSSSLGSATERRISRVWPYRSAATWPATVTATQS